MKKFILTTLLTIAAFSTMLGQFTLSDSLQLYYKFNGNVTDYSQNNISATVNGATLTNNRFGTPNAAYSFDGVNDYIICDEQDEILNQNFDAFTISVWVYPESLNTLNGGRVINNRGTGGVQIGNTGYQMCLVREPSLSQWGISNTVVEDEDDVLYCGVQQFCGDYYDFNTWHHYVMVYDSGSLTLYMDAISQGMDTSSTFEDISNTLPTLIGASGSNNGIFGNGYSQFFDGKIDDIRIYNRALSTVEIGALYVFNDDALNHHDVINPVSATTTLTAQFGSNLDNTINGAGLDDFPSLSATHGATNPNNAFYATNAVGTIDFDLGGSFLVDGLAFWNANAPGPGGTGINDVMISASEDGVTFTPISGSPTTFTQVMTPTSPAEMFTFDEITASYIRLEVLSNHGGPGSLVGFAEIAFSGIEAPVVENVINPVSATTNLSAQFGSSLDNTINGVGLDAFPSLSATHGATNPNNAFNATNAVGTIDFDLGGSYLVDGLAFWNTNAPGPGGTGIKDVVISSSEDGITYTPIAGSPTVFTQVMTPTSPAERFTFTEITASYIRFDVLSNFDGSNLVGFAEVAFSGVATLGANDNVLEQNVSVFPNPASDFVTINNSTDVMINSIEIYDMNGRLVEQLNIGSTSDLTINVSELTTGMYLINITSDQATVVKRLIKK